MSTNNKNELNAYNQWQKLCRERKEKLILLEGEIKNCRVNRDYEIVKIKENYEIKIEALREKKRLIRENKPSVQDFKNSQTID